MKTVKREATVGFDDKNDALVTVTPCEAGQGIRVELTSPVKRQYGEHLEAVVLEVAKTAGYTDVKINVQDKGAWDYALRARVEAALARGDAQ